MLHDHDYDRVKHAKTLLELVCDMQEGLDRKEGTVYPRRLVHQRACIEAAITLLATLDLIA